MENSIQEDILKLHIEKAILFRVDAGKTSGYGHLNRCISLAELFSKKRHRVFFLIKSDDRDSVISTLKNYNFIGENYLFLENNISKTEDVNLLAEYYNSVYDFLVLDHYAHDFEYQVTLKNAAVRWAQFDYKCTDTILSDLVINTNPSATALNYINLSNTNTKLCLGAEFAIINENIRLTVPEQIENHVLISFGAGTYPVEIINLINEIIKQPGFIYHIVSKDPKLENLIDFKSNINLYLNIDDVSNIYRICEIGFVAGGITAYELAYLNIPLIIIPFADNQIVNAAAFEEIGLALSFLSPEIFSKYLNNSSLKKIKIELSKIKKSITIDGRGCERIVNECIELICK
ncbi:MAG TPA: hypothetical protein VLZ75_03520 [Chitinophagales bacterium]|nr:hypothetical protein [Chitinophagales bacterium]